MKEQILTLERTDDLHSVRDKIFRAQANRLLLVWPAQDAPFFRRLDLALMRRWAAMSASEIVLISADPAVAKLAARTGLESFPNLTKAALAGLKPHPEPARKPTPSRTKRPPSPPPARRMGKPLSNAVRVPLFLAAVLLPITALGLSIPAAVVHASFPGHTLSLSVVLPPAACTTVQSELTLTDRQTTSGRIQTPVAYATGSLVVTNFSTQTLDVPAGVRFSSSDGISVTADAGFLLGPGRAQTISVRVVDAGPAGNLPAGSITRVDGPLALSLKAVNPLPLAGGASAWRSAVTQADLDALQARLSAEMRTAGEAKVRALAGDTSTLAANSIQWKAKAAFAPDYPVNTPTDTVAWTMQSQVSALLCPNAVLLGSARSALETALQSGETLQPDVRYSAALTSAGQILLTATGKAAAFPSSGEIASALRFQTPGQATAILSGQFHASLPARIEMHPDWFPVLPLYPYRIDFRPEAE